MELKQETVKQIRGLIIFTAVLIVCLWKFDVVISAFQFVLNIVYPFLLGGADCICLKCTDELCRTEIIYREKNF